MCHCANAQAIVAHNAHDDEQQLGGGIAISGGCIAISSADFNKHISPCYPQNILHGL
jgi:hypothetical protein